MFHYVTALPMLLMQGIAIDEKINFTCDSLPSMAFDKILTLIAQFIPELFK
jgi:hypothetical protein